MTTRGHEPLASAREAAHALAAEYRTYPDDLEDLLLPFLIVRDAAIAEQAREACAPPTLVFHLLEAADGYDVLAKWPIEGTIDGPACAALAAKLREHAARIRSLPLAQLLGGAAGKEGTP